MLDFLARILGYLMSFIYNLLTKLGDDPQNFSFLAMSIIIATILIKLLTLPLQLKSSRQMKKTQELQPQVKEIQIKFKHDPQAAQMKIQKLYRENNASMTGGCLPLLIQFPIILAFFRLMRDPSAYAFTEPGLYESMHKSFFWIKDLTLPDPYWFALPLLVGLVTYLQSLTTPKVDNGTGTNPMQTMNYIMPVMLFWFARSYSAGLALYWVVSTAFTVVQSFITNRSLLFKKGE